MAAPFIRTALRPSVRHQRGHHPGRLTPITDSLGLLLPGVKHGRDNQEARCDGTFADAQEHAAGEEPSKACRGCVAEKSDGPDENVDAEGDVESTREAP